MTLAATLLIGPLQSESAASLCGTSPRGGPPSSAAATGLVEDTTGVPVGVQATEIRWVRWHNQVVYGDSTQLQGQVVTEDGAIPDANVDLLARQAGSTSWTPIGSATTDHDTGVFTFGCLRPELTTEYQAVYGGTLYYGGSEGTRTVAVARRVPDSMRQVAADRFRFLGSVEPTYAGRPVLLQRKSCLSCRWTTVLRKNTSARSGWAFTIDVSTYSGGRWFRAAVPADASFATGYSDRVWRLTS